MPNMEYLIQLFLYKQALLFSYFNTTVLLLSVALCSKQNYVLPSEIYFL